MAHVTVVMNPKGGIGKSTIATNLAGYFANRGKPVMLGDVDKRCGGDANADSARCARVKAGGEF